MGTLTDTDFKRLADSVEHQATKIARRYDCVTADDVKQEIWLWACENAEWVQDKIEGHMGLLSMAFYRAGFNYADKEWKASIPGDWRDQYTYSRSEVARLLPLALDESDSPGLSGGGLHDGPSSKADPAYGGGLLASIMDVRVAFSRLSVSDQTFLEVCVEDDQDWERIGARFGLQSNSAYAKYMRILDRMVTRHLGRATSD